MSRSTKVQASKVSFLEVLQSSMVDTLFTCRRLNVLHRLFRNELTSCRGFSFPAETQPGKVRDTSGEWTWKPSDPSAAGFLWCVTSNRDEVMSETERHLRALKVLRGPSSSPALHAGQHLRVRPDRGGAESSYNSTSCHPETERGEGERPRATQERESERKPFQHSGRCSVE